MTQYLYQVAKNGTYPPELRHVIKETPRMYILDGITDTHVPKRTMCNRFYQWFTHEEAAQAYYNTVKPNYRCL